MQTTSQKTKTEQLPIFTGNIFPPDKKESFYFAFIVYY